MNNEPDLLPCPFCNASPIIYNRSSLDEGYDICCQTDGCYLETGAEWFLPKDEVIAKWNRRIDKKKYDLPEGEKFEPLGLSKYDGNIRSELIAEIEKFKRHCNGAIELLRETQNKYPDQDWANRRDILLKCYDSENFIKNQ